MNRIIFLLVFVCSTPQLIGQKLTNDEMQLKISNGILEGEYNSGITSFKGIPFAAPPVGEFRWREPQPVKNWTGVRKANKFGPRAMQRPLFTDMQFRSDGVSEDCLYLNVWTPAKSAQEKLPVLVYFYGGGLMAGDGSEYRYDGENMARRGIVTITVNYRLTVFGFFAHPELTKESPHKASGNYGFLDQAAALAWVNKNIAAFGGDPKRVTIAGESAGSFSVCAQMASPLSKKLIAGAIGESGSLVGSGRVVSLQKSEENGVKFAAIAGVKSLADLRKLSAEQILAFSANHEWELFPVNQDGYFFPEDPSLTYKSGRQALVPLMAGWNSEEGHYSQILGKEAATPENFRKSVERMFGNKAVGVLEQYKGTSPEEIQQAATDLASDGFIGQGTWKWIDLQAATSKQPVYRYYYTQPRPPFKEAKPDEPLATGAAHSAEIEYAMGNLSTNKFYNWQADDYKVSTIIQGYFVNFIKTGNPNGLGLPDWPVVPPNKAATVMHIGKVTEAVPEKHRERYLAMDKQAQP